jgi:hypothetical protein
VPRPVSAQPIEGIQHHETSINSSRSRLRPDRGCPGTSPSGISRRGRESRAGAAASTAESGCRAGAWPRIRVGCGLLSVERASLCVVARALGSSALSARGMGAGYRDVCTGPARVRLRRGPLAAVARGRCLTAPLRRFRAIRPQSPAARAFEKSVPKNAAIEERPLHAVPRPGGMIVLSERGCSCRRPANQSYR